MYYGRCTVCFEALALMWTIFTAVIEDVAGDAIIF